MRLARANVTSCGPSSFYTPSVILSSCPSAEDGASLISLLRGGEASRILDQSTIDWCMMSIMIPPFEKRAKYHRNVPGGIYVHSREEELALGPEWVDRPDLVGEPFKGSIVAVETKAQRLRPCKFCEGTGLAGERESCHMCDGSGQAPAAPEGGDQLSEDPWTTKKRKALK